MRKLDTLFTHRRGAAFKYPKPTNTIQKSLGRLEQLRKTTKQTFGAYKQTLRDGSRIKSYTFGSKYGTLDLVRIRRPERERESCVRKGFVYSEEQNKLMTQELGFMQESEAYKIGQMDWQNPDGRIHVSWEAGITSGTYTLLGHDRTRFRFYAEAPSACFCNNAYIRKANGDILLTLEEPDLSTLTLEYPVYSIIYGMAYDETAQMLYMLSLFEQGKKLRAYAVSAEVTGCGMVVADEGWTKLPGEIFPDYSNVFYRQPSFFNTSATEFVTISGSDQNRQRVLCRCSIHPTTGVAIEEYIRNPLIDDATSSAWSLIYAADWQQDTLVYVWRDWDGGLADCWMRFEGLPYADENITDAAVWEKNNTLFADLRVNVFIYNMRYVEGDLPYPYKLWTPVGVRIFSPADERLFYAWRIGAFPAEGDYVFWGGMNPGQGFDDDYTQEAYIGGVEVDLGTRNFSWPGTVGPGLPA